MGTVFLTTGPGIAVEAQGDGAGDVADQPVLQPAPHGRQQLSPILGFQAFGEFPAPVRDQVGPAADLVGGEAGC
jgi:hypothetical protein